MITKFFKIKELDKITEDTLRESMIINSMDSKTPMAIIGKIDREDSNAHSFQVMDSNVTFFLTGPRKGYRIISANASTLRASKTFLKNNFKISLIEVPQ